MRIYQLYATANQANAASVQIKRRGRIVAISWAAHLNSVVDNDSSFAELSFSSTSQITTNDAYGVISAFMIGFSNFVTSGLSTSASNFHVSGLSIDVDVGNVLYINTSGVVASTLRCLVHVVED